MAGEISLPWDGTQVGDAGNYSSEEWRTAWKQIIGAGAGRPNTGIIRASNNAETQKLGLDVEANSPVAANVLVRPGSAVVNGGLYVNTIDQTMTIAANASGNARIDLIVLRMNVANQEIRLAVLQGTPAASPATPALTQTAAIWEIALAEIAVANGFATLAQSTIRPIASVANGAPLGIIYGVQNKSAITLKTGMPVIISSGNNKAVTTTTTVDDPRCCGVWLGSTAVDGYGDVVVSGEAWVYVNNAVSTRYTPIVTGSVAGEGTVSTTHCTAPFAIALETTSGASMVRCLVGLGGMAQQQSRIDSGPNTTSSTTLADISASLNITMVTTGRDVEVSLFLCDVENDGAAGTQFSLYDVDIDGTLASAKNGLATGYLWRCATHTDFMVHSMPPVRVANIAPGSHVFKPRWALQVATGTLEVKGYPVIFTVREIK